MNMFMTFRGAHFALITFIHILLQTSSVAKSTRPLEGIKLRCCTLVERPMVYEDGTGKHTHGFSGIAIEYLALLEDRLGFRCETLKLFKANRPENQGFTGFVFEMEECTRNGTIIDSPKCKCDIGVGGWVLNEERMGRVDFVPSYINDDFRMLTHIDNVNYHSASGAFFLTAFSTTTWIAIFGLIVMFIFLKLFDRRFAPPDPRLLNLPVDASRYIRFKHHLLKSRLPERLKKAIKNTLLEIIGQSTDDMQGDSQTTRQWLLTYILLLCGLFLVLAYEATMTASLVQEVARSDFRTIDDLKSCRIPAEEVCVPAGGAAFGFWQTAIANLSCNQGAPQPKIVGSYGEGHQKVASKQCRYFLASGATTRDAAHGRYCGQVATTGEPFFTAGVSYVLPRGSNLTRSLTVATLQLRVLDAVDTLDQYFRRRGECEAKANVSLTFGRLKVFFIMAFAACAFMFAVMLICPQGNKQEQNVRELDISMRNLEHTDETGSNSEASISLEKV